MFHLDITWFFFKRRLQFFCKFLRETLPLKSAPPPHHGSSFVRRFAASGQHSTNKHYTSSNGFIQCGELANFLEKLQFFSKLFWPWILCCSGLTSLTWCGPPGLRQCFDIINFFRRHNFAVCLCHFFSRVSLRGGGGSCLDYDSIVGLPICQTLLLSFLNYGEILLPLWCPTNGSVIVVN